LITSNHTAEKLVAALGAYIPGFFILDPFLRPDFPPVGNGPQNNFFTHTHGKIIDISAGKVIALVTSGVAFLPRAVPDLTPPAMHKPFIG
jgi:hypothetical protein